GRDQGEGARGQGPDARRDGDRRQGGDLARAGGGEPRLPDPRSARPVTPDDPGAAPADGAPSATRHDLHLGRRLFHLVNGVSTATAYALFFTHEQVIHVFGTIACIVSSIASGSRTRRPSRAARPG